MDLFDSDLKSNILPFDGVVQYQGVIFNHQQIQQYFNHLINDIEWKNDEVKIFGKQFITKRKVAWYADDQLEYIYSNRKKEGLIWTDVLLDLKRKVEELTNESYNSCLLNLYHDGDEGMGWHSDDEKSIVPYSAIASLSFGATRKFSLKHKKTKQTVSIQLESGSLLLMKGETQVNWLHSLPKTKKIKTPRINLTFRKMIK
ncbi:alpha-ketoglutarate-dependent dioxygenase AlkB [Pelobium sp.]|nr:alpha-ketoglutarate-dependent dioxygenase AlkB [Pelobium sp.]MDA9554670.1 alpha-ketoglutarate-dependent dioxygenase AlkB [Pelobium sp.]